MVKQVLIHDGDHPFQSLVKALSDNPIYGLFLCDGKNDAIMNESVDDINYDDAFEIVPISIRDDDLFLYMLPSKKDPFGSGSYMLDRLFDVESHGTFADGYHLEILFIGTIPLSGVEFIDRYHIDLLFDYDEEEFAHSFDLDILFGDNVDDTRSVSLASNLRSSSECLPLDSFLDMEDLPIGVLLWLCLLSWGTQLLGVVSGPKKITMHSTIPQWIAPIEFIQSLFKKNA